MNGLSGRVFADGSSVLCRRPHGNESFVPHSHSVADRVGGRGSVQPSCIHVKAWVGQGAEDSVWTGVGVGVHKRWVMGHVVHTVARRVHSVYIGDEARNLGS